MDRGLQVPAAPRGLIHGQPIPGPTPSRGSGRIAFGSRRPAGRTVAWRHPFPAVPPPGAARSVGLLPGPRAAPIGYAGRVLTVLQIILVLTSLILIGLVLLHKGKGGGLSDMFGGGISSNLGGSSVAEKNLDRITIVTGLIWTASIVGVGLLVSSGSA